MYASSLLFLIQTYQKSHCLFQVFKLPSHFLTAKIHFEPCFVRFLICLVFQIIVLFQFVATTVCYKDPCFSILKSHLVTDNFEFLRSVSHFKSMSVQFAKTTEILQFVFWHISLSLLVPVILDVISWSFKQVPDGHKLLLKKLLNHFYYYLY